MLVKKEEEVPSDFPTPISTIETFFNYCVISLFLGVFYSIKRVQKSCYHSEIPA